MRMVVDNREGASVGCCTGDAPLGTTAIDQAISVSVPDGFHHVRCRQVSLLDSIQRVLGPDESDDLCGP
jgi:hypothetical protein